MAQAQRQHQAETLYMERRFDAAPERVFDALTRPDQLAAWFGPSGGGCRKVHVDLRPGGAYGLEMQEGGQPLPLSGEFVAVDRPRRLVKTWAWGVGPWAGIETLVTIELEADGAGTLLRLTHENLDGIEARDQHGAGWQGGFDNLARLLTAA